MTANIATLTEVLGAVQAQHHQHEASYLHGARDESWAAWYAANLRMRGLVLTTAREEGSTMRTLVLDLEAAPWEEGDERVARWLVRMGWRLRVAS